MHFSGTSDFLFYYAKGSKAKGAKEGSTEKPKAGVLYQQKEALYWWIIRKLLSLHACLGACNHGCFYDTSFRRLHIDYLSLVFDSFTESLTRYH